MALTFKRMPELTTDDLKEIAKTLVEHLPTPQWRNSALCAQTDPEIFFPPSNAHDHDARFLCSRCPVKLDCLGYALNHHSSSHGIWAGTRDEQREQIRKLAYGPDAVSPRQAEKQARDEAIIAMHLEGVGPMEIASAFEISDRTVHRVLAHLRE